MAALAAALLAHGRPSPLAPVLAAALPSSPLRDERTRPSADERCLVLSGPPRAQGR